MVFLKSVEGDIILNASNYMIIINNFILVGVYPLR